jgi:serine/threonine protein kinase
MSSPFTTGTKLGRYEIRSKLGAGGMGEVYMAEDNELHRNVALKVLPANVVTHKDRMLRFKQEATAAAALTHPNIARRMVNSSPFRAARRRAT